MATGRMPPASAPEEAPEYLARPGPLRVQLVLAAVCAGLELSLVLGAEVVFQLLGRTAGLVTTALAAAAHLLVAGAGVSIAALGAALAFRARRATLALVFLVVLALNAGSCSLALVRGFVR